MMAIKLGKDFSCWLGFWMGVTTKCDPEKLTKEGWDRLFEEYKKLKEQLEKKKRL